MLLGVDHFGIAAGTHNALIALPDGARLSFG